jgi:Rha family phage regulatory protein
VRPDVVAKGLVFTDTKQVSSRQAESSKLESGWFSYVMNREAFEFLSLVFRDKGEDTWNKAYRRFTTAFDNFKLPDISTQVAEPDKLAKLLVVGDVHGQLVTTSLCFSDMYGRSHSYVLSVIRGLIAKYGKKDKGVKRMFTATMVKNHSVFLMNKDGFDLLCSVFYMRRYNPVKQMFDKAFCCEIYDHDGQDHHDHDRDHHQISDLVENSVYMDDGQAVCDSLTLAANFGYQHKYVLRLIRNTIVGLHDRVRDLVLCENRMFIDNRNREQPFMILNRAGFDAMTVNLTNPKAKAIKRLYVHAFDMLEDCEDIVSVVDDSKTVMFMIDMNAVLEA